MPKVKFDGGIETDVGEGTSLLEAARACGAPMGSACGGNLACSTCHVWVNKGVDSLTDKADEEEDILDKAFDVRPSSRLGCQARCAGADLEVTITRESRQAFYDEHPDERRKLEAG